MILPFDIFNFIVVDQVCDEFHSAGVRANDEHPAERSTFNTTWLKFVDLLDSMTLQKCGSCVRGGEWVTRKMAKTMTTETSRISKDR